VEEPSQEAGEAGRRINRAWTSSDLCRRIRGLQAVPEGGVLGAFEPVVGGSEWRRQLSAYTGEVAGCVLGNVLGVLGSQRYPRTPCASRARAVQDPASELPRIHLLRTPVHRGTATTVSSKCMKPWGGRTAEFFRRAPFAAFLDGAGNSQLDVALPLPYLGRVRLELLDEADDEAAQLDQGLIAHLVVEEELCFESADRHEGHVGR
jgi:hypothetical protein